MGTGAKKRSSGSPPPTPPPSPSPSGAGDKPGDMADVDVANDAAAGTGRKKFLIDLRPYRRVWPVLLCLIFATLVLRSRSGFAVSGVNSPGWKGYLPKLNLALFWSETKSIIGIGDKPSYLYSAGAIQKLATLEKHVYEAVKQYSVKNPQPLFQRYMADYEESSVNMMKHGDDVDDATSQNAKDYAVVANPIIAHRIIRRFAIDIPGIRTFVASLWYSKGANEFLNALKAANPDKMPYPTVSEDYNNSLYSILRIQRYSSFNTTDLSIGKIGHLSTGIGLQARHAMELGSYAGRLNPPIYTLAVEWLELALDKWEEEKNGLSGMGPKYKDTILKELKEIVEKHDNSCSAASWSSAMEHCFAFLIQDAYGERRPGPGSRIKGSDRNNENAINHFREQAYSTNTRRNFINTCSGRNLQTEAEKARLNCWYETKKHPYLTISPFKIELLNEVPPLIQIYDVLGPQKRETLMTVASPKLTRSLVVNVKDPKVSDVSDVRTSVQTWIYDNDDVHAGFLDGISRQIEYISGLNVRQLRRGKTSEAYQVASYRTSQHYDEHMDALADERRTGENGDRIGTLMFYLTDVEVGGMTGFPALGTAAKPVAGSAVFWHNLWKNGSPDQRTWHGGCPVAHGVKWVTNKWILYYNNFDKRRCTLDPSE